MANGLSFDAIFLRGEQDYDKCVWAPVAGPDVAVLKGCCTMKIFMSHRGNMWCVVSALPQQYYPGWRSNNKAIQDIFLMARLCFVPLWKAELRSWRKGTGVWCTRSGGGYFLT